jgi:hypothetical protein
MTMAAWRFLGVTFIAALVAMPLVAGQSVDRKRAAGKPISFGDGVRAADRLSPTPQYSLLANGLYARQIVLAASARGDYTVQVWSLLVSPHTNTAEAKLPGAVVLTLYAGNVELVTGDQKTRLEPGATAVVPEGTALRFVNGDDKRPAQLRAVVLSGNR